MSTLPARPPLTSPSPVSSSLPCSAQTTSTPQTTGARRRAATPPWHPTSPAMSLPEPLTTAGHQCRAPPAPKPPPSSPLVRFKRPETPPAPWSPLLRRPPRNPFLRPPSTRATSGNEFLSAHWCSPTPPPPPQPSGTPPPWPSAAAGRLLPWSSASALPQPQLSPHSPSSPPTEAPKPGRPIPAPPASRRRGTDPPPPPPFAAPPLQAIPAQPETAIRFAPTSSCSPPTGPHPR